MKKSVIIVVAALGVAVACQRQVSTPASTEVQVAADEIAAAVNDAKAAPICFEADVLPIFQSSCAKSGCHDMATHKEGYILDSYEHIMRKGIKPGQPFDSELFEVILRGEMPPAGNPPLTNDQLKTIGKWIKQGAQNTTNCSTCDTSQYTYSGTVSVIMQDNCTGCHSGSNPSAGIDLSSYKGVRRVALDGRLMGTITWSPGYSRMPKGGDQLDDCSITQIGKWVEAGAPNN